MIPRRIFLVMVVLMSGLGLGALASAGTRGKNSDLVIQGWERWIDTLKGRVKNFSPTVAHEVTVVVDFRNAKGKVVERKTAKVGSLQPGEEGAFEVEIPEKLRTLQALTYKFTAHALWR